MTDKIGVYIYTGDGIGESLDIDALIKVAKEEYKVDLCKTITSCEGAGLDVVRDDIKNEGLTKIVIAGYSPRATCDIAEFGPEMIIERVNLREMVVWCQPPNNEDTQMMANDYLRMGIVRIQKTRPKVVFEEAKSIDKTIMVVGAGIAGLTAALESAKAGYETVLVEKEAELGGWMKKWYKSIPSVPPYQNLEDNSIPDLVKDVQSHDKIKVLTSTLVKKINGGPGLFDVEFKSANGSENPPQKRVGAIIQATGFEPHKSEKLADFGYGKHKNVITNVELEEMAKNGEIKRPSDGQKVNEIAFIQCAGSKEKEHLSYCSSVCCLTSLKQAKYLREKNTDGKAYIFYENLRTPGHYEDFYKKVQEDPGIFLTRGDVKGVEGNGGKLTVNVEDTMVGENIAVDVDLIVLAAGMKPHSVDGEKLRKAVDAKMKEAKDAAEKLNNQEEKDKLIKDAEAYNTELMKQSILNLGYRQGPDLPALTYDYPDSHFICFPYETRRTGIYAAGTVRSPMDGFSAKEDATGAALKAIQCVEMTSRGEAVHPRSGDISWPEFSLERCTQCKRCTEECPFGVLNEDVKGTPLPNATRCRRCGVCMGACPERIVNFRDYSIDIIASMIKAVEVPDEFEEKPRVLAFVCENDAYPTLDIAGKLGIKHSTFVRFIPLRCLGSVNVVWVSDALSKGFDGVLLFGCKFGDDYQCHFIKGSELADYRGDNVREKLTQMALENERVQLHQIEISEYEKIPKIVDEFVELIESIGMNPFKGM
ncbi:hydrogenase iron-sulfur subunit [bacterium]|nr:hydrogenase iron-sulfur subunit [bacterium]